MQATDIRFYLSVGLKRLHYVTALFILCVTLSIVIAYWLPPVYSASAKILVEAPQIPAELARSTVPVGPVEQLQIIQQQITSRENLLALASTIDEPAARLARHDEDIIRDMTRRIRFEQVPLDARGGKGTMVFNVSFLAGTPDVAANVANRIAEMILGSNQRQRTDRAETTLRFFDQEVSRLTTELGRVEAEILKFKTENRDSLPESLDFRRMQQGSLQDRITALERDESDQRTRRSNLLATYMDGTQQVGAVPMTAEQQTLANLNRVMSDQLALFTEGSPYIQALRGRIQAMERDIQTVTTSEDGAKGQSSTREATPGGLRMQLADIDNRVAAIASEKARVSARLEELSKSISATPGSEIVLNALERNRQNLQTQYNAAIARRADASMGEQIEMRDDGGRFSLLEAASPPQNRLSPQRTHIVAGGAAAGGALGLGLVVLLEFLNTRIRRPSDLLRSFGYEPFATIPDLRLAARASGVRQRRIALFALALLAALMPSTSSWAEAAAMCADVPPSRPSDMAVTSVTPPKCPVRTGNA